MSFDIYRESSTRMFSLTFKSTSVFKKWKQETSRSVYSFYLCTMFSRSEYKLFMENEEYGFVV